MSATRPLKYSMKDFFSRYTMEEQGACQKATHHQIDAMIRIFKEKQTKQRSWKDLTAMHAFSEAMEQFGKVDEVFHRLPGALVLPLGPHDNPIAGESLVDFIAKTVSDHEHR